MTTAMGAPQVSPATAPPYQQVPILEKTMAVLCLVINILIPGIGTIVAGVLGSKPMIGRGVAQLLLTLVIVGWIWGVVTGVQLITNATWAEKNGVKPA